MAVPQQILQVLATDEGVVIHRLHGGRNGNRFEARFTESTAFQVGHAFGDDHGFQFLRQSKSLLCNPYDARRNLIGRKPRRGECHQRAVEDDAASVRRDMMPGQAFQRQFVGRNERIRAFQGGGNPEFLDAGRIPENMVADRFHAIRDQEAGQAGALLRVRRNDIEAGQRAAETEDAHPLAVGVGCERAGALVVYQGKRLVVLGRVPDLMARRQFAFGEAALDHCDGAACALAAG